MTFIPNSKFIWLLASWIRLAASTDYCSDVQCMEGQHTMCKFPDETPGSECSLTTGQGVNAKQIEELLHVHNRYRDYVAAGKETRTLGGPLPKAANMRVMTWDKELARIAQRWALQCHFGHDDCRGLPNMKVGQNVGISGSTNPKPPNMTKIAVMWYEKEVGLYNASEVSSFQFSMDTAHFTQWIWATSDKLGCGYTGFKNSIMYSHLLVCNYGPAGNWMRRALYLQGPPCSDCPEGTACSWDRRYPNLCQAESNEVLDGDGSTSFGKEQFGDNSDSNEVPRGNGSIGFGEEQFDDNVTSGSASQHIGLLPRLRSELASGVALLLLL